MEPIDREYNTARRDSTDEIDLIDLLTTIWSGKYIIAAIVAVVTVLALVGLKLTDSYYRIDVVVDLAAPTDIRLLEPSILNTGKTSEYQVPDLNVEKIFELAIIQATSLQMQKSFWEQKTGEPLSFDKKEKLTPSLRAFYSFRKNLAVEAANPKTPMVTSRKITFLSTNPDKGVLLLNEYLAFLNHQILENRKLDLVAAYQANITTLTTGYQTLEAIERQRLADKLLALQESLKIAESLGIKETPYAELENVQLSVLDNRDYVLGAKALQQQIELLMARQGQSLAPFAPLLRELETWKYQIELDLKRLNEVDPNTKMFAVVRAPEASLEPVKPNKLLILLAAIMLAGFFWVFFVLLRASFAARAQQ